MDVTPSTYQILKILLAHYIPIDRDFLHVLIGLLLVLIAAIASRKQIQPHHFTRALLIACVLGAGMEFLDRRDDLRSLGNWRWQESVLDFLRTVAIPSITVLAIRAIRKDRTLSGKK